MLDKLSFSDTIQQQELLENLIVEFNKFSSIDTDFWSWCNANEGVIAFGSVIASFLVSIVAVGLSLYTFRSQKVLQTKNAQDNARLQRELTEQNNKLQTDIQLRHIKLSSYDIKINYWKTIFHCYQFVKKVNAINKLNADKELGDAVIQYHNEISTYPDNDIMLNELIFILDCNDELKQQINSAQNSYGSFCMVYKKLYEGYTFQSYMSGLCAIPKNGLDEELLWDKLETNIANLVDLLPKIIEKLEKHIDIINIDKIKNES